MGKFHCGFCGRKCSLDKDFCIPQDSVYICKSCYNWQQKVSKLEEENRDLHTTINLSIPRQIAMKNEIDRLHTCRDKRISELLEEKAEIEQSFVIKINNIKKYIANDDNCKDISMSTYNSIMDFLDDLLQELNLKAPNSVHLR